MKSQRMRFALEEQKHEATIRLKLLKKELLHRESEDGNCVKCFLGSMFITSLSHDAKKVELESTNSISVSPRQV